MISHSTRKGSTTSWSQYHYYFKDLYSFYIRDKIIFSGYLEESGASCQKCHHQTTLIYRFDLSNLFVIEEALLNYHRLYIP